MRISTKFQFTGLFGLLISAMWFYDLYFDMHLKKRVYAIVCTIYSVILLSIFTMETNSLFYKSVTLVDFGAYAKFQVRPGIFFIIFSLTTIGIFLKVELAGLRKLRKCMAEERVLYILMMIGPVFSILCILAKWIGFVRKYDFMALVILGLLVCLTIVIVKYNYFQTVRNEAEIDPLTKVSTRAFFESRVNNYLKSRISGVFIMIDIDNFKYVNDTFGHAAGDCVLVSLCDTLRKFATDEYCITRMGGDEFCVFVPNMTEKSILNNIGPSFLNAFIEQQRKNNLQCDCTCSIGAAIYNQYTETSFQELYNNADKALYLAKNSGKGQWRFY